MSYTFNNDPTSLLYRQTTQLEGIEYSFRFYWADREGAWYFDIGDQDGNWIAPWIRVVVNTDLLRRFQDPRLPPGLLTAIDQAGAGMEVQVPSDLGTRVVLTYVASDELAPAT